VPEESVLLGGVPEAPGAAAGLEARATDFVIRLVVLGLFCYWSIELVRPFLGVVVWSVLLTAALYPVYAWFAKVLGGRPTLAAVAVTGLALATILGPVSMLAASLVETGYALAERAHAGTIGLPPPPPSIAAWPVVGAPLNDAWVLASSNLEEALARYGPALRSFGAAIVGRAAAIGGDIVLFVVSVVIMGFLFRPGPRLAAGARAFAARLIAPRGAHFVDLAGATIRNVARGVIGVALLQTLIAGIILEAAGVPGAGLLAFAILILCIVQIGPAPVIVPVLIWAWATMSGGTALALTLLLAPVFVVDNVLKPILMARGLTTPLLVILTGVIGGTISYGLVGLFLGPIVLAVFYELLVAWVKLDTPEAGVAAEGTPLVGEARADAR
jgi:predicted PurR-regulated permease PerM